MSFATRCTACGTIFRVVQDQLLVSEGWVRCGRCAEVFDAREQLFDIDLDSPPVWTGDAPMLPSTPKSRPVPTDELTAPDSSLSNAAPISTASQRAAAAIVEAVNPQVRREPQWVDAESGVESVTDNVSLTNPGLEAADPSTAVVSPPNSAYLNEYPKTPIQTASAQAAEIPSFMRQADAAGRWRRSGRRLTMAGLTVLLVIALLLQLLFHFRDAIAALYPASRPSLQALCQSRGCVVQPWRRIEALTVENSALAQAADTNSTVGSANNNRYQLTMSLRNRSGAPVATPSVELSLLNSSGLVVLRRVLNPSDFQRERPDGKSPAVIAPSADVPLHLQLTTGTQRISGYSVEIFHP